MAAKRPRKKREKNGAVFLAVTALILVLLVVAVGHWEISSFYNDPNHIGFAVPVTAFVTAFFAFVVWIVLLIIVLAINGIRRKRKQKMLEKENTVN